MGKKGPAARPAEVRFWENVTKQDDGCWIYAKRPDRYGQITVGKGKVQTAHRFSYTLHKGEIAKGLFVCHKCDVRGCVNPEHLYAGTHEDNTRDIVERGRIAKNTARVVRAVNADKRYRRGKKLYSDLENRMKEEYASGKFTQIELAKRYRVSQATVSCTIRGTKNQSNGTGGKKRSGHFRRKVQPEQYQEIRDLYATGQFTQNALAERFGIDQTTVSAIINFKLRGMKP